jgi:hypothetical protein
LALYRIPSFDESSKPLDGCNIVFNISLYGEQYRGVLVYCVSNKEKSFLGIPDSELVWGMTGSMI